MQIRQLNPAENPRDAAAIFPAFRQWQRDFLPGLLPFEETRLRHWCTPGYKEGARIFGAFADESATEAEGFAAIGFDLTRNLELTWGHVHVPAGKRDGVEVALFEQLVQETKDLGRKRLAIETARSMAPLPFLDLHGGGRVTDTAIMSTLDLSALDVAHCEKWAEPSAKNGEYTLVGWVGRCPDELAESLCRALDAMADRPMGTFEYEFEKVGLDRLAYSDGALKRMGIRRYVQVALDPAGEVAGFHMLAAYPDEPEEITVWNTGVPREHRGHGLGLRLKAAAMLWILEDRPSTRLCTTFNDEANQWMLAVNRTMGYQPLSDWPNYEFVITD
jgi:GNAT superfamily N-acetyltransferase